MRAQSTAKGSDLSAGSTDDEVTERLGIELWRFQHALRATLDSALDGSRLSVSEYCVLALVQSEPDITSSDLADQIFITRQALGRTIARLRDAELLLAAPADSGPSRPLQTTPLGDACLDQISPAILEAHRRLFEPLTAEDRADLIGMISRCSDAQRSATSHSGSRDS